jgi:hypothetical protein
MDELEPSEFYLAQNYPNPFKERTVIKYCVAFKTRVNLKVYNAEGKEIEKLVDEEKKPGTYEIEFSKCHSCESLPDGKAGGNPQEGSYFYRLEAGDYTNQKTMIISK